MVIVIMQYTIIIIVAEVKSEDTSKNNDLATIGSMFYVMLELVICN